MTQLIADPTRITANTSSVLDHVIVNKTDKVIDSGVLDLSLSDHQAVFMVRGAPVRTGSPVVVKRRVFKNYSREILNSELRRIDWSPVYLATDVSIALTHFNRLFLAIIDIASITLSFFINVTGFGLL